VGHAIANVKVHKKGARRKPTGIRVAIAAFPRAAADLTRELQLAKAALLYADHVTVCSGNSTLLASLDALANLNEDQKLKFIRELAPTLMPGREAQLDAVIKIARQRHQGGAGFRLTLQFRQVLESEWRSVRARVSQMLDEAGAGELEEAIKQGLVSIDLLDLRDGAPTAYQHQISKYLQDADTYPLFDDDTGKLVRAGRSEGIFVVPTASARRATEIGLAAGLIGELPAFADAEMARVLEARVALEPHVRRFRVAVNEFRRYLEATALDEGFHDEVASVYAVEVQAAMDDIQAALKAPPLARLLLRAGLESTPFPGVLGLVAFEVGHLDAVLDALLSAAAFGASVGYRLETDRQSRQAEAARNDLYFLYRANEILKR
jgi:hypothetical protein